MAISSRAERIAPGPENTPGFTYPVCAGCDYIRYWSQPTELRPRITFAHLPQCYECEHTAQARGISVLKRPGKYRTLHAHHADAPLYVLESRMKAQDEIALENNLHESLLTVGMKKGELRKPLRDLHRFLQKIKRLIDKKYGPDNFHYSWVLEWQMDRLKKYGDLAQHFHIRISAPPGCMPDYKFVQDATRYNHYQCVREGDLIEELWLWETWGRGLVLCEKAASGTGLDAYLGKKLKEYLQKNLNDPTCPRHSAHLKLHSSSKEVTKRGIPAWAREWKEEWQRDGQLDDPERDFKFAKHRMHLLENNIPIITRRTPWKKAPNARDMEELFGKELQMDVSILDNTVSPTARPEPSHQNDERWRDLWTLEQDVLLPLSVKDAFPLGNPIIGREEIPLFGVKSREAQKRGAEFQPLPENERGMRTYRGTFSKEGYGVDGAGGQTDAYGKPRQASYLDTS